MIQAKLSLPPTLRNSQILSIVQLFKADAQLFKTLLQASLDQAHALTVPEKALIEKVLREVSNTSASLMQADGKASGQGEASKAGSN